LRAAMDRFGSGGVLPPRSIPDRQETFMRKPMIAIVALSALSGTALAQMAAPHFVTLDRADMLSSNVVGLDVYDNSNNDIGTIKDVAFDSAKAVKGYVLSVGGFLGMGAHYVAVDTGSVKIKYDDADKKWHANMNATKDQLKAAPEFKYEGQWNATRS
jgi:sporulation protein YlmC with PRC-barrel domain